MGNDGRVISRLAKRAVAKRAAKQMPLFKVIAIAQVGLLARRHVQRLAPGEARRIAELVRRRNKLTETEKAELRDLTAKLEPREFIGAAADQLSPVPLPRRFTGAGKR